MIVSAKSQNSRSYSRQTGGGPPLPVPNRAASDIILSTMVNTPLMDGCVGGMATALGGKKIIYTISGKELP